MLIVSKERYLPVSFNTIVLHEHDNYFYIHRDVYDQAVILSESYASLEELAALVGGYETNRDTVRWFHTQAPKPLNILAPYLLLIDGHIEPEIGICCGALHVITSLIQVRSFILKPQEVRRSVCFSLSIKEEYEMAWDRFFISALPYNEYKEMCRIANDLKHDRTMNRTVKADAALPLHADQETKAQADPLATSLLDGISAKREENGQANESPFITMTESERKATRNLLI